MTNEETSEETIASTTDIAFEIIVKCPEYIAYRFVDAMFKPAVSIKPLEVCGQNRAMEIYEDLLAISKKIDGNFLEYFNISNEGYVSFVYTSWSGNSDCLYQNGTLTISLKQYSSLPKHIDEYCNIFKKLGAPDGTQISQGRRTCTLVPDEPDEPDEPSEMSNNLGLYECEFTGTPKCPLHPTRCEYYYCTRCGEILDALHYACAPGATNEEHMIGCPGGMIAKNPCNSKPEMECDDPCEGGEIGVCEYADIVRSGDKCIHRSKYEEND